MSAIRKQDYLKSNERSSMKLLPEVYHGPTTNPLNFGDDPAYDQNPDYDPVHVAEVYNLRLSSYLTRIIIMSLVLR